MQSTEWNNNSTFRVLIVDDVPENLQVLSKMLYEKGIEVGFALNGQQALDIVSVFQPDLILLDVAMPVIDGFEVCKRLKNNETTSNIPVIFVTAHNQPTDIERGFKEGAVDYIYKPFNANELTPKVFAHIKLKRAYETIRRQNAELQKEIQERIKIEEQVREYATELKESNDTKTRFLSIIAHDLRNPFSILFTVSEILLAQARSNPELEEIANIIHNTSQQTHILLENLLLWARARTGRMIAAPETIMLKGLISQNIEQISVKASAKNVSIVNQVKNNVEVIADRNMLHTIVRNLLSNAVKYTPSGGTITVSNRKRQAFIEIQISDTGIGIEKHILDKLFKLDANISTPATDGEKGSGLGLILCKEFVELNGGKIQVVSEPQKGTSFFFTVPTQQP